MFLEHTVFLYIKAESDAPERPCAARLWFYPTASALRVWGACGQESLFPFCLLLSHPNKEPLETMAEAPADSADPKLHILRLGLQRLEPHCQQTPTGETLRKTALLLPLTRVSKFYNQEQTNKKPQL